MANVPDADFISRPRKTVSSNERGFLSVFEPDATERICSNHSSYRVSPTPDHPNPNMQSVFEAVGFAWKAGVGRDLWPAGRQGLLDTG